MAYFNRKSRPVLVLKSGDHWGLGIVRSLGRLGIPVHVVNSHARSPAFFSRYCRQKFVCDITQFGEQSARDLLNIGRKIGRRSILIPTTDDGAIFVADHAEALREWFIFPEPRPDLVHSLCSKKEAYYLAKKFGVCTPQSFFPQSREQVLDFLDNTTFPIMLKPISGWALKNARQRKAIVHTEGELMDKLDAMEDPEQPNVMLQEYIPGANDAAWIFHGYFDQSSDCLLGFTGRKIGQWPIYHGVTSLGMCLNNEIVEKTAKEFMEIIGYRGIVDIDFVYDSRDGNYKVLDINPRIGANFRLFVTDNGMDVARALYLDMTGQSMTPGIPLEGRKWLVEDLELESSFVRHLRGDLSWRQWLGSYRGVREAAYFAFDDPPPLLHRCMRTTARLFWRLARQILAPGTVGPLITE